MGSLLDRIKGVFAGSTEVTTTRTTTTVTTVTEREQVMNRLMEQRRRLAVIDAQVDATREKR